MIASRFTPQRKAIGVNDKFGNKGIKKQQGSTVIKYDTLEITGQREFRFFEGSASRVFPLTNCQTEGNKLGVGNTLVLERAYLTVVQETTTEGVTTTNIFPLGFGGDCGCGDTPDGQNQFALGEFGFEIANSQVVKNVPYLSWTPQFNKVAENSINYNFDFDTQIVIPPLLEFVATLRVPAYTWAPATGVKYFLRLTIEGTGAIIAPRTTF